LNEELVQQVWGADKLAAALQTVSLKELREHGGKIRSSAALQALAFGNVSTEAASDLAKIIESVLSCPAESNCKTAAPQVRRLDAKGWYGRDIDVAHNDSAVLMYVQGDDQSDQTRALMALTAQVLQADYFQQLRTQQQLGYVVFATTAPLIDVPGLGFIVQSPTHSVAHILQATNKFLSEKRAELGSEEFPQSFEQHRAAVLSELRESAKNMSEQTERYWADLSLGYTAFHRRSSLIKAVETMPYAQWREFFAEDFSGGVIIWSKGQREFGASEISLKTVQPGGLKQDDN